MGFVPVDGKIVGMGEKLVKLLVILFADALLGECP